MLINDKFFQLLPISGRLYEWMGSTSRALVGTLAILFGVIALFINDGLLEYKESKFIKKYLFIYSIIIILTAVYTLIYYSLQPAKVSYKYLSEYLIVLEVIPLCKYLNNDNNVYKLFEITNLFSFIHNIMIIAQQFLYSVNGTLFLPDIVVDTYRSGSMRIGLDTFGNIFILFNFYYLFYYKNKNKNKIIHLVYLLTGIYSSVVVQQTRMYILDLIIVATIVTLVEARNLKKFGTSLTILLVAIILFASTGYFREIVQSFSSNTAAMTTSRSNRLYGFEYYFKLFLEHPFFGMGFARNNVYRSIVHGPLGIADITDVGFVGQLGTLGVGAFIVYIPVIYYLFKTAYRTKNRITLISALYVLITSTTLIIFNAPLILLLPFLLAYAYYDNKRYNENMNKEIKE